jgi:YggT family protein
MGSPPTRRGSLANRHKKDDPDIIAGMLVQIIQAVFLIYTLLLFLRVMGSWIPQFAASRWMRLIGLYTDPYLNLFRRWIPPLGVIDISPMLAFSCCVSG